MIVVVAAAATAWDCVVLLLLRPFPAHSLTRLFDAAVVVVSGFFSLSFLLSAISKADVVVVVAVAGGHPHAPICCCCCCWQRMTLFCHCMCACVCASVARPPKLTPSPSPFGLSKQATRSWKYIFNMMQFKERQREGRREEGEEKRQLRKIRKY